MNVEIEDFSSKLADINAALTIDPASTAIVTVDMHRGHLDPKLATMPCSRATQTSVIAAGARVLTAARSCGIPVCHVTLGWRPDEFGRYILLRGPVLISENVESTPEYEAGTRHNIFGSPQIDVIPELLDKTDVVINNKKTFSIYRGTDLEMWLNQIAKVDTVVLMGINTNTCVQNAAFDSANAGIRPIVVDSTVGSMYGDDLHQFGLQNIARCIGWVLTEDEFYAKLGLPESQASAAG